MTAKRLACVVNPHGGRRRGIAVWEQVEPVLIAAQYELDVRITQRAGHAREIARTMTPDRYEGCCVVGGDGTIHEVVNGLMDSGRSASIPLGLVAAGTGNDVVRQLGGFTPAEAARRIVAGKTAPFDLMKVESGGRLDYCLTIVGWTGVADINCTAECLRALGPPRYAIAALCRILSPRWRKATLTIDGQATEDHFLLLAVCNTVFAGSGMRLAPRAKVDDGKLDVLVVRKASRWQMVRLFAKVFHGSHLDLPCVEYRQACQLSIHADDELPLDLDGEIKGVAPVSVEAVPGALRVFV